MEKSSGIRENTKAYVGEVFGNILFFDILGFLNTNLF